MRQAAESACSCAQRLSASEVNAVKLIPGLRPFLDVLNAFRRQRLMRHVLNKLGLAFSNCAQRLSASEVNADFVFFFIIAFIRRAQRLSASEVNAGRRRSAMAGCGRRAQRLSASEVNAEGQSIT